MLAGGIADNWLGLRAIANGRSVASFTWCDIALEFDQHGVVYVASERIINGVKIRFVTVGGELNAIR